MNIKFMNVKTAHTVHIDFNLNESDALKMKSKDIFNLIQNSKVKSSISWNRQNARFPYIMEIQLYCNSIEYDTMQTLVNDIYYMLYPNHIPVEVPTTHYEKYMKMKDTVGYTLPEKPADADDAPPF